MLVMSMKRKLRRNACVLKSRVLQLIRGCGDSGSNAVDANYEHEAKVAEYYSMDLTGTRHGAPRHKTVQGCAGTCYSMPAGVEKSYNKKACIAIEKLLDNTSPRQKPNESTTKNKPINIGCDPLKPNSSRNSLGRQMSVLSAEQRPKTELAIEKLEVKLENINYPTEGPAQAPSEGTCNPLDMKTDAKEIVFPSGGEENLIEYEAENVNIDSIGPTLTRDINLDLSNEKETTAISNSVDPLKPNTELKATDGGSSNSLPHFMQVTESARAKMKPNNSPRSSPDVQDREYVKNKHSLPGANGRQGSPCIQQSVSSTGRCKSKWWLCCS